MGMVFVTHVLYF